MGSRRHLWPGDELGRGTRGRVHAKQEVVLAVGGPIVKYRREGRGQGGEATWWAGLRGRYLSGKAGEGEEEAAGLVPLRAFREGGRMTFPWRGAGPSRRRAQRRGGEGQSLFPRRAGRRGRGRGHFSARVRGGAGGTFRGAVRLGEGRGEGEGAGPGGGAGKGEAPADNGAYVCLREWDGAAAAAAAAGGRRCAAAAAGPGSGPPGLRAAPDRSPLPYSAPTLPSPTPASGVSGTSRGGEGEGKGRSRGVGGPGPRPRVLSRFGGRDSHSRGEPGGGGRGEKGRGSRLRM